MQVSLKHHADHTLLRALIPLFVAIVAGSLVVAGCSDRVLPPDNGGNSMIKTYRIAYNTVLDGHSSTISTIGEKGEDRKELGIPRLITAPPGGGYIVSTGDGDEFLDITDVRTGIPVRQIPRRYGNSVDNFSPAISPDGTRIAYSVDYNNGSANASTRRVVIAKTDGGDPVLLDVGAAYESYIRFSPDGNYIAFFDATKEGNGWLYVARTDGTDVRRIADVGAVANDGAMSFSWSPDGKMIAYTDFERYSMCIASVDGSGVRNLGKGMYPDWSPDGEKIVCLHGTLGKLALINSDGTSLPESLGVLARRPQWSPDGKKILYFTIVEGVDMDRQASIMSVINVATKQSYALADNGYYGYWID